MSPAVPTVGLFLFRSFPFTIPHVRRCNNPSQMAVVWRRSSVASRMGACQNEENMNKGVLVAIEGIDGAGKTTQARRITERMRSDGFDVVLTKEPTDGQWGTKIRLSAYSGRHDPWEELVLFMNDREEHVAQVIGPSLEAGKVVVVDRYYYSSVAYQGARGLPPDDILEQNEQIAPRPDLVALLNVAPTVGVSRVCKRDGQGNFFEREDYLGEVAQLFRTYCTGNHVLRIDGVMSAETITAEILRRLYEGPLYGRVPRHPD